MQLTPTQTEKIASSAFLVTGGAGFIGSHIAEFLLNAGARKVRVLDNMTTGHFRNLAPFANHRNFEFVRGDIRDPYICKDACNGTDYVFHQAALVSEESIKYPITTNNINATGFLNMLLAAHDAKVKRFVYASDSPMYEHCMELPPLSPYAVTKNTNELYADVFSRIYKMETIGLQYCNVFGQRQDPQSVYAAVIPKFVMKFIKHESPVLNGANEYCHNFTYVENVVQANMLAILTTDPQAVNQVFDTALEGRISLFQLARYLKEFLSEFDESIQRIEISDGPDYEETAHLVIFAEKAKKLLGYQPLVSLRNGLIKSAGWYLTYLPQFEEEAEQKRLRKLEIINEN